MERVDDGRHAGVLLNGECEGRKVVWEERVGGLSERASSERGRRPPANELSRSRLGHELDDGRMATDRSTARAIREPPISRAAWPVEPKPCNLPAMACRSIWLVGRSCSQELAAGAAPPSRSSSSKGGDEAPDTSNDASRSFLSLLWLGPSSLLICF